MKNNPRMVCKHCRCSTNTVFYCTGCSWATCEDCLLENFKGNPPAMLVAGVHGKAAGKSWANSQSFGVLHNKTGGTCNQAGRIRSANDI